MDVVHSEYTYKFCAVLFSTLQDQTKMNCDWKIIEKKEQSWIPYEFIACEFPHFYTTAMWRDRDSFPTCCDESLQGEGEIAGGPPARSASRGGEWSWDDRICILLPGCKMI